jgi:cytochrome c biogenesis protein CcmG/thiol:disulfide interchange protein DsbE
MQIATRTAALVLTTFAAAAAQSGIRASLHPPSERKTAEDFALRDADGKSATLGQYRGKILLLNFWATGCGPCRKEIPWLIEFEKKFGADGLAVVGISLDEDGWKVLKPFLARHTIPYRIILGDAATAKRFGIHIMPDSFLIDRQGRVAAAYLAGLVDKANMETNVSALVSEH